MCRILVTPQNRTLRPKSVKSTSSSDASVTSSPRPPTVSSRSTGDGVQLDLAATDNFVERTLLDVKETFRSLSIDNIESVRQIYTADITFIDPFTQVNGIDNLVEYFSNHYANLQGCYFDYTDEVVCGNRVHLEWRMSFRHPHLSGGNQIDVDGISTFVFEHDRVSYHRDYFDSSAVIYQNIPVLRGVIKFIRGRIA